MIDRRDARFARGATDGGSRLRRDKLTGMRGAVLPLALSLSACVDVEWQYAPDAGAGAYGLDGGRRDAGAGRDAAPSDDGGALDAGSVDAISVDAAPNLLTVGHPRELRGMWLTTVYGLDFPSRPGLDAASLRAELAAWCDLAVEVGLNAIFFQVRPESDALYASSLEPSSRFLSGAQGAPLALDPLAELIHLARARALEVHAWLNPYRAQVDRSSALDARHVAARLPDHAHPYGDARWMDPGAPEVRTHVLDVVRELLRSYDLDGLHFDDYFYPYPESGVPFPDTLTWQSYQAGGGPIGDRGDWRRQNVHELVRGVHELVIAEAPWVRFGISPFGIYRPGQPPGITGLDQYDAIYSDPLEWIRQGWVDYLAPQLYWPSSRPRQAFAPLLEWWRAEGGADTPIYPGLFTSQLGQRDWPLDEIVGQIEETRRQGAQGHLHFRATALAADQAGVRNALRTLYAQPALPPPMSRDLPPAPPPRRTDDGFVAELAEGPRAWLVYRLEPDNTSTLLEILPPEAPPPATPGAEPRAVSVVYRGGRESAALRLAP